MRVVEVISGLGAGGAEKALATRLKFAPGHVESHVISTTSAHSKNALVINNYADIHWVDDSVLHCAQSLNPDVIITHNPREALRLLSHSTLFHEIPIVVVAHNEVSSEFLHKRILLNGLLPLFNPRAHLHIAVSSRAASGVQCARARKVRICLLGAELEGEDYAHGEYWPLSSELRVLVLGRFSPQKNLAQLVKAVHQSSDELRSAKASVLLVGDGELRTHLEKFVSHLQLGDIITLLEWVDDPTTLLQTADALLIPSRYEGGPLTLYEALLAGTPVTSTRVGAVEDVLRLTNGGLQLWPDITVLGGFSDQYLRQGLLGIIERGQNSSVSRSLRAQRFSWLRSKETAHRFYTEVLNWEPDSGSHN